MNSANARPKGSALSHVVLLGRFYPCFPAENALEILKSDQAGAELVVQVAAVVLAQHVSKISPGVRL